jgi:hypothetical protein
MTIAGQLYFVDSVASVVLELLAVQINAYWIVVTKLLQQI